MDDEFLTVMEIAETLKLNPQTIRNWIDRGELPAVRLGARRVRVLKTEFDAFLAAGSSHGPRAPDLAFRVALSDEDTSRTNDGASPRIWIYEVSADGADRAASIATRRWRDEVGNKLVARSLTVLRTHSPTPAAS